MISSSGLRESSKISENTGRECHWSSRSFSFSVQLACEVSASKRSISTVTLIAGTHVEHACSGGLEPLERTARDLSLIGVARRADWSTRKDSVRRETARVSPVPTSSLYLSDDLSLSLSHSAAIYGRSRRERSRITWVVLSSRHTAFRISTTTTRFF